MQYGFDVGDHLVFFDNLGECAREAQRLANHIHESVWIHQKYQNGDVRDLGDIFPFGFSR